MSEWGYTLDNDPKLVMVQPNYKFEKKQKTKPKQIYFGSTEGDFNSRYNNTLSLFSKRCKLGTELPKHV